MLCKAVLTGSSGDTGMHSVLFTMQNRVFWTVSNILCALQCIQYSLQYAQFSVQSTRLPAVIYIQGARGPIAQFSVILTFCMLIF